LLAEMNERDMATGAQAGFVPPLRLTGGGVTGRPATGPSRTRRRGQRPGMTERAGRPLRDNRTARGGPRRGRTGQVHAVVASMLAVVALVGCVIAVLILATEPTAARLQGEVASLNSRLHAAQIQLAQLHRDTTEATAQGANFRTSASGLRHRLAGLQRTVHGLQGGANMMQEQSAALRDCAPQLQQELAGLTIKSRSVRGRLTSVGLTESTAPSPACQTVFSGTELGG
jgi:hypothetical protein